MMRLKGKTALVTSATTGIGEAIARRFAQEGARVMVHGPASHVGGEEVVRAIQDAGGEAAFTAARLEEPSSCTQLVCAVAEQFGALDILVNNAAVTTRSTLETTDAALFDAVMAVNLRAPLLLARAALPLFRSTGGGTVLNIGSVNGLCGERNLLAYSVSKGGLMTLSRNLADAHGPEGIRVIHFNVGWVLTPSERALKQRDGLPGDWPDRLPPETAPAGRLFTPDEIAYFALCYADPEAQLVNGAVVELEQFPSVGRNLTKTVT